MYVWRTFVYQAGVWTVLFLSFFHFRLWKHLLCPPNLYTSLWVIRSVFLQQPGLYVTVASIEFQSLWDRQIYVPGNLYGKKEVKSCNILKYVFVFYHYTFCNIITRYFTSHHCSLFSGVTWFNSWASDTLPWLVLYSPVIALKLSHGHFVLQLSQFDVHGSPSSRSQVLPACAVASSSHCERLSIGVRFSFQPHGSCVLVWRQKNCKVIHKLFF
jgi:hypothetical protein